MLKARTMNRPLASINDDYFVVIEEHPGLSRAIDLKFDLTSSIVRNRDMESEDPIIGWIGLESLWISKPQEPRSRKLLDSCRLHAFYCPEQWLRAEKF